MQQNAEVININQKVQVMPSQRGFVSLWRDIDKQPWYKLHKGRYTSVFIHLLIKASHKPTEVKFRGDIITLLPGQIAKTYEQLARELNQTKSDIQNAIRTFKKHGQITTKTDGKYTIICIENWSKFNTVSNTVSNTVQPLINKEAEAPCNTGSNTAFNTQNNNVLNNNKDNTCQNSSEFSRVPMKEILSLFNKILPSLPQPKKITSARQRIVKARHFNDLNGKVENWERYFNYIKNNCTWMLEGKYNISFDYLTKQQNFVNIYEGARDDK